MKNKKWLIICCFLIIIIIILFRILQNKNKTFFLEDKYYEINDIAEIKIDELNDLINRKESFAVFIYQPMCITSSDFENILYSFLEENNIGIYKITFSEIKDTEIGKFIKYYPSFIIYNKGKMIDFLEANKDEDVIYYSSKEGFKKWFTEYVKLKNNVLDNQNYHNNEINTINNLEQDNITQNITIENVIKENNKINIYFFWGDGCIHCEEEFKFFESIKEKYGEYYNLYTFETWYDEENKNLLYTFSESMGEKISSVPYTIIGNIQFKGFKEEYQDEIINIIENQYMNSYDIYFDKIKE